jgi:hypothetical protein
MEYEAQHLLLDILNQAAHRSLYPASDAPVIVRLPGIWPVTEQEYAHQYSFILYHDLSVDFYDTAK